MPSPGAMPEHCWGASEGEMEGGSWSRRWDGRRPHAAAGAMLGLCWGHARSMLVPLGPRHTGSGLWDLLGA